MTLHSFLFLFFFFNDTATTEIYTLSLHDALPIYHRFCWRSRICAGQTAVRPLVRYSSWIRVGRRWVVRSEEHTSELQSLRHLVCRLLLEKKKKYINVTRVRPNKHTSKITPSCTEA